MSLPNPHPAIPAEPSMIAGSVLPIQRAEELLATLPGVISARIVASPNGAVDEIHILTTTDVTPKQTVRNVESALIAHLGMHVSHKKISVATSEERQSRFAPGAMGGAKPLAAPAPAPAPPVATDRPVAIAQPVVQPPAPTAAPVSEAAKVGRRIYFEDVEVRRSRSRGVTCRVTLRKGTESYLGEAEGIENERLRIELAARAALQAIRLAEGDDRILALEGCRVVEAFDHTFVFVGVTTKLGRESTLMTGSAEIRESPETASVLAILDATNRWLDR
ncbi:MAG TPA: hypothetical protein VNC18_20980 [Gemmatimonadaceae bacterium]|nr:hypothetical protein [Gemmatimonadaceae bacterium]